MISPPVLAHFNQDTELILETDASILGLGAVLKQVQPDGQQKPIAYASQSLSKAERNYSTCEQELLAVVWAVDLFDPYLGGGKEFQIITDHNALVGLLKTAKHTGRLSRWKLALSLYRFSIRYRPGSQNNIADCLSRFPLDSDTTPVYHLLSAPIFSATTTNVAEMQRDDPACQ